MAHTGSSWRLFRPLGLAAVVFAVLIPGLPASAQARGPASVFVADVGKQDFAMRIEALGTLKANERVDLTLNVADRVTALYFDDGERVVAGKTLLSLAQREQVALVEAAEANSDEARRQYQRAIQPAEISKMPTPSSVRYRSVRKIASLSHPSMVCSGSAWSVSALTFGPVTWLRHSWTIAR